MEHALRLYFLGFYVVSVTVFVAKVVPASLKVIPERRAEGPIRLLPPFLVILNFVVPPLLIFTRVGELEVHWLPVRLLGFAVSLYAAGMLVWAAATLGRFLVPQAVVLSDHDLVTTGPYRFVRHPVYSGDLGLWLGAALARNHERDSSAVVACVGLRYVLADASRRRTTRVQVRRRL